MKIVFATNNAHKLQEIREILGPSFEIVSLNESMPLAERPASTPPAMRKVPTTTVRPT